MKSLSILGVRGVPANHGGFETFAENLVVYLVNKDWKVTVYCQESYNDYVQLTESEWCGVRLVHIPVKGNGAMATISFDFLSVKHASKEDSLILTLGYNTALFNLIYRIKGKTNLINMDGIEWKREKWKWYERAWLYMNERAGCLIGNHLIADHPEIKNHLVTRVKPDKVTMIPYGARCVDAADVTLLADYDLLPDDYAVIIARPEPENSIFEIVSAFSAKPRGKKLVVLGKYDQTNPYHYKVLETASNEVKFVGAIYDHTCLDALRYYSCLYIHGHTVGGTNPSLIEALGAGQSILAHDNKFNRWVAGVGAVYFNDENKCSELLDMLLNDRNKLKEMSEFSINRFNEMFTWNNILLQYENLLLSYV